MDLKDKIAVITGGASGIGLGLGQALASRGAKVVLADVDADKAKSGAKDLNNGSIGAEVDVRDTKSLEKLAELAWGTFGRVDIFVSNAGVSHRMPVLDADSETTDWILDVNLKGVLRGVQVFGRRMREQKTTSILCNTASEHAIGLPHPGSGVYTASKHAVLGLSDVLRHELPEHMRVCVVCPGLVASDMPRSGRHGPPGLPDERSLAFSQAVMAQGMAPREAGEKIADGLEREDFLIFPHPHAVRFAQKRWQEISDTFAKHAPYTEESEKYEAMNAVAKVQEAHKKSRQT